MSKALPIKDFLGYYITDTGNVYSRSVVQIKNGIIIAEFGSLMEAERNTGISHSSISNCCLNKCNSAGKCQWKYKDLK